MKSVRRRLTYANVMSSIAVFLVVAGGSALAAGGLGKNTVGSKQLKNNAVTSAKIKNGAVSGAKIAAGAVDASKINTAGLTVSNASHATSADSATSATNAANAANAAQLGGVPASGYARAQLEAVNLIGAAGKPAFENGCSNLASGFQPAGFYKDPFGIVHLVGDIVGCTEAASIFVLPAGFRPTSIQRFSVHSADATVGTIRVDEDGEVATFSTKTPILNGLTFRTN